VKRISKNIVFILLLVLTTKGQSHNSNFEFSGMNKFWEIVEIIKSNEVPTEKLWNDLFSTPGYKVLTQSEFKKEFFIKNFTLAFNPNKKAEYERTIKNRSDAYYLEHYRKADENKSFLVSQVNKLKISNKNSIAANKALNFLPMNNVNDFPPVSFVIFANDGRGYSPIVIDLFASTDWDFIPFLAHEYHHWYRNRLVKINYSRVNSEDKVFIETISQLEAEGVADQVDKAEWFLNKRNLGEREKNYIKSVEDSPGILKKIIELLEQISDNVSLKRKNFDIIKEIVPQGGHPTGFYMARMILKQLGRGELVRTVGNPFVFIHTFNNAAKMEGINEIIFSSRAMRVVSELENNYL